MSEMKDSDCENSSPVHILVNLRCRLGETLLLFFFVDGVNDLDRDG
jgi:hypothetical protein